MKQYILDKQALWDILEAWDLYLPQKVRVVACGGTALTLQDLKESTKDVDFLVPEDDEYKALLSTIQKLGYRQVTGHGWAKDGGFVFDLFRGKSFDLDKLKDRYKETALYDVNPEKMMKNLEYLLTELKDRK